MHQEGQVAKNFEIVVDKEWEKEVWSPPLKVMQRRWFVVVLRALLTPETNDDLLSILSEDPPGEGITLVVSKANPITLLFIR